MIVIGYYSDGNDDGCGNNDSYVVVNGYHGYHSKVNESDGQKIGNEDCGRR